MDSDELHEGAMGHIFNLARSLRVDQTRAERTLWHHLRGGRLRGFKFRRQHPLQNYIADFYCYECKLVIELDGAGHVIREQAEYDRRRSEELGLYGIRVIRFTNEEVRTNLPWVLNEICRHLIPHP